VRSRSRGPQLETVDGFTMVEVLVAMAVLAVGILALAGAFDSSRRLTLLSERRTAMAHEAQLEIERLQTYPFSELAMISRPEHSSEKSNPDYYVNTSGSCNTEPCYAWNAENTSEEEKLVIAEREADCAAKPESGCGLVAPSPTGRDCKAKLGACEWADGLVKGRVYDFVTYHADVVCAECKLKAKAYRRLTVVVTAKVTKSTHETPPLRVSTLIAEPH
jgi:prepilin-type N-terminal cleavage/methylation domain-containing protein